MCRSNDQIVVCGIVLTEDEMKYDYYYGLMVDLIKREPSFEEFQQLMADDLVKKQIDELYLEKMIKDQKITVESLKKQRDDHLSNLHLKNMSHDEKIRKRDELSDELQMQREELQRQRQELQRQREEMQRQREEVQRQRAIAQDEGQRQPKTQWDCGSKLYAKLFSYPVQNEKQLEVVEDYKEIYYFCATLCDFQYIEKKPKREYPNLNGRSFYDCQVNDDYFDINLVVSSLSDERRNQVLKISNEIRSPYIKSGKSNPSFIFTLNGVTFTKEEMAKGKYKKGYHSHIQEFKKTNKYLSNGLNLVIIILALIFFYVLMFKRK